MLNLQTRTQLFAPLMAAALLCLLHMPAPASAAEQLVRGKSLRITDRTAGGTQGRQVVIVAEEKNSPALIVGDPTIAGSTGGGLLQIVAEGSSPSSQVFPLPQGLDSAGKPYWRARRGLGFRYSDKRNAQGPVRSLVVQKGQFDTFRIRAALVGTPATLAVAPPNPGTQAYLTLSLGGADRTCVKLGSDGDMRVNDANAWSVSNVTARACPPVLTGEVLTLSYNVAGLPQGISGSDPEANTPLIAPLLDAYELVLMQETWKTPVPNPFAPLRVYHEILEAGTNHAYKSVSATNPLGADPLRPSALLADGLNQFSRFPFEPQIRTRWTSCHNSAADCLALKGFAMARTTFAPGVTVDVYDLHMEAGGDPQDDILRDEGVTLLANFINTSSAGNAVIVGGDFNLHTSSEPDSSQFQRLLTETGLLDVCATLACPEPGRIDKFLFRSNTAIAITPLSWRFETDVFRSPDGDPLSDHDALAVRFGWTATGS